MTYILQTRHLSTLLITWQVTNGRRCLFGTGDHEQQTDSGAVYDLSRAWGGQAGIHSKAAPMVWQAASM